MSKIYCTVAENGIEYRYEETDSPIFVKKISWLAHKKPKVIEYLGVENSPEVRKCLEESIFKGKVNDAFFYRALVKHGHGTRCGFYPLPLIFATERERNKVAADRGVRPPSEAWVMAKRQEVMNYYGLNEKSSILKRLFEFFGSKNSLITV